MDVLRLRILFLICIYAITSLVFILLPGMDINVKTPRPFLFIQSVVWEISPRHSKFTVTIRNENAKEDGFSD